MKVNSGSNVVERPFAAFCVQVGFWDKPEVLHQSSPTADSAIEF
jgi:hypothetical protein